MGAYTKTSPEPLGSDLYWAEHTEGEDFVTKYGTRQFLPLRCRCNASYESGVAISAGVPSDDDEHDSVPVSTIIFNPDGGDGTALYVVEETGAAGIAPVSTGNQA